MLFAAPRGVNRLRDLLTGIFSALVRAFGYSTRSSLILLTGILPREAIRATSLDAMAPLPAGTTSPGLEPAG